MLFLAGMFFGLEFQFGSAGHIQLSRWLSGDRPAVGGRDCRPVRQMVVGHLQLAGVGWLQLVVAGVACGSFPSFLAGYLYECHSIVRQMWAVVYTST